MTVTISACSKALRKLQLSEWRCKVEIVRQHNHASDSAAVVRHLDVTDDVHNKLLELLRRGHSPTTALLAHQTDLMLENGDAYPMISANKSVCPDIQYVFRLYYREFKEQYGGGSSTASVYCDLSRKVQEFNDMYSVDNGKSAADMIDGDTVVAICTPLMARAHQLIHESGELVFIDSSGNMDRHCNRVFLLMTHSNAGGIPLGIGITTSERQDCITAMLEMFKTVCPTTGFYGRQPQNGPLVIMTDDSASERNAVQSVWPQAVVLLCTFHVLQACWRWLWNARNGISKQDRPQLLNVLRGLVNALTEAECQSIYSAYQVSAVSKEYPQFAEYLGALWDRRKEFCVAFRKPLPVRGVNTNNFVESGMRILKENVFERTRAFNVVQLFDFLVTRYDNYMKKRLLDVAHQRRPVSAAHVSLHSDQCVPKDDTRKVDDNIYAVRSGSKRDVEYTVDMSVQSCECDAMLMRRYCKHLIAVYNYFYASTADSTLQCTTPFRNILFEVATGRKPHTGWLTALHEPPTASDTAVNFVPDTQSADMDVNSVTAAPEASGEVDRTCTYETADVLSQLEQWRQRMTTLIAEDAEEFVPAARKFLATFDRLHTQCNRSELVSALHNFGGQSGGHGYSV